MKINGLNLPIEVARQYGLKAAKMDRLNQIVLLAGRNGAGKTRFLEMLRRQINAYPGKDKIEVMEREIHGSKLTIDSVNNNISSVKRTMGSREWPKEQISRFESELSSYGNILRNSEDRVARNERFLQDVLPTISFNTSNDPGKMIDFVPKSLVLQDSYIISPQNLNDYAVNIYHAGTTQIARGAMPAIEQIQKKWVNINTTVIDDLNISAEEKDKINSDYERLRTYIKMFLGTELKRSADGNAEIFEKRLGEAKLSDGQKIILQFCIALYGQEKGLDDLIIFMDEPENHLHPAAILEVLDKIIPNVKNGQIWIATHSVNVLAHFDPSYIWYIDNGEVSYAGNLPEKVLKGLVGEEEEIAKLSHFLSLPAQMASEKFAFESLFYPHVLVTGPNDPQVDQIFQIIQNRTNTGQKLKVLDFGIGKGRLLSTIYENERIKGNDITQWLDFYGYDIDTANKDVCVKTFETIYGGVHNRYFNDISKLNVQHDEDSFDVMIMCNVFHEIEPKAWLNLFNSATSIFKLLKPDGHLVIVEDQLLAIGEKAHSKGFLVFDSLEFKRLFKITAADNFKSLDYRGDGRLKAHFIPKSVVTRIDAESRKEAIAVLLEASKSEIRKIRDESPSFKNGKLHGFWAQQLANASLALEEL